MVDEYGLDFTTSLQAPEVVGLYKSDNIPQYAVEIPDNDDFLFDAKLINLDEPDQNPAIHEYSKQKLQDLYRYQGLTKQEAQRLNQQNNANGAQNQNSDSGQLSSQLSRRRSADGTVDELAMGQLGNENARLEKDLFNKLQAIATRDSIDLARDKVINDVSDLIANKAFVGETFKKSSDVIMAISESKVPDDVKKEL